MFGIIFVILSNVFNFMPPIGLDIDEHKTEIVIYYSAFWMLYNIGFTISNTSHLAMIPELCDSDEARMSLTLIRNTMINLANILAYIAALIVFSYGKLRYDLLLIRCLRWKIVIVTRYLILLVYLIFNAFRCGGFSWRGRGTIQKLNANVFCCRFYKFNGVPRASQKHSKI